MAEKKAWLGVGVTLVCLIALLFVSPMATSGLGLFAAAFGLIAGLVELVRKRASKPWFVLLAGSVVLLVIGSVIGGTEMHEKQVQKQERQVQQQEKQQAAQQGTYEEACGLLAAEKYQEAVEKFSTIKGFKDSDEKLAQAQQGLLSRVYAQLMLELDKADSMLAENPGEALGSAETILKRYYEVLQSKSDFNQLEVKAKDIIERANAAENERRDTLLASASAQLQSGDLDGTRKVLTDLESSAWGVGQKERFLSLREQLEAKEKEREHQQELERRAKEVEEIHQKALAEIEEARTKVADNSFDEALSMATTAVKKLEGIAEESPKAAEPLAQAKELISQATEGKKKAEEEARAQNYQEAKRLLKKREYQQAKDSFAALGDYEDSRKLHDQAAEKLKAAKYQEAQSLHKKRKYIEAKAAFAQLGSYKDSQKYIGKIDTKLEEIRAKERRDQLEARDSGLGYKQLSKNPDRWIGTFVKFRGKVFTIKEEEGATIIQMNVTHHGYDIWDDQIVVLVERYTNIVEDNVITVFGTVQGSLSFTTVAGWTLTVPAVKAEAIYL